THFDVGERIESNPNEDPENALTVSERAGKASIAAGLGSVQASHGLSDSPASILPYDTYIQKLAEIAQAAGESIAFLNVTPKTKAMFRRLGKQIEIKMKR
ncbi:MAG: hypothetical protein AAFX03_14670, partial [Pseudomonadota bacterium]